MKSIDMTRGDLKSEIIKFAIPMFIASLIQNLYNIADRIWVGRTIGKTALSAVGIVNPIMFLILALSLGMSVGTTVLVSQNTGAKNNDGIIKTIDTSLIISGILSIVMMALGYAFFEPILRFMGAETDVIIDARSYMNIILIGIPFVVYSNTIAAVLRGLGDSKSPTIYVGIAAVINIVLDPLLILGLVGLPKMLVAGAAVATIFSQFVGFVLSYMKILQIRKKYQEQNKIYYCNNYAGLILKLGFPSTIQTGFISVANMMVMSIISSFSDPNITSAFLAGNSFDSLAFLPAFAIGQALSTSAGQNTGTKDLKRVSETAKIGLIYIGAVNAFVLAVGYIFAGPIIKLFLKEPEAIAQGVIYLRIFCFFYLPFGLMTALNSVTQGIGNTILPMITSVTTLYLVRLPLANYLAYKTSFGIKGVYWAMALTPICGFIIIAVYFYSGVWKKRVMKGRLT